MSDGANNIQAAVALSYKEMLATFLKVLYYYAPTLYTTCQSVLQENVEGRGRGSGRGREGRGGGGLDVNPNLVIRKLGDFVYRSRHPLPHSLLFKLGFGQD